MTIHAKLRIGAIVTAAFIFIFIVAIFFLTLTQQKLAQKGQVAERINETSFQLALLRSEYLAHPNERPKTQWIHAFEVQSRLLDEAAPLFTTEREEQLFAEIRQAMDDSRVLFGQIIRHMESGGDQTVIEELSNQMTLKAQIRVADALELSELSRGETGRAAQTFMVVVIILGLIVSGIVIALYFSSARIAESLRLLGEGTKIIAGGNLTHRLPFLSNDEISELATLFNTMAKKLQTSHDDLEQKVKDRTKEISTILSALDTVALVSMTDAKGDIIYANDKFVEVSKYTREELLGHNHRMLKSGQQPQSLFINLWKTISTGNAWRGEILNHAKDGTEYWADTSIAPILDAQGKPERYIAMCFIITERKREEQAKSEFVSLASHQLRTPLTEIRWALSSIAREVPVDAEHKKTIEAARDAVANMSETIRVMLTIAHIESDNLPLQASDVQLKGLLDETVRLLDGMGERRNISTIVHCSDTLVLHTDAQLLKEILNNLLSNAYKYTPESGTVTLRAERESGRIHIEVSDTGVGIPLNEQGRIFQKFFRAANAIKIGESGSGLGLYVVHSLAHLLGGDISFVSTEHVGTTFTLRFPSARS